MIGSRFVAFLCFFVWNDFLCVYSFPNPIDNYLECGLTKPGRICDPKSVLSENNRTRANEALMKLSGNVFAIIDISQHINTTNTNTNITMQLKPQTIDLSTLHKNLTSACQRRQSDCSSTSTLFLMEFLKMPTDSVGGERFDIFTMSGLDAPSSGSAEFAKALDAAMPDFAKLDLANGFDTFATNLNAYYGKSAKTGWTSQSFPNPCVPANQCGLDKSSVFICDPDSVLKLEPRQRVNAEFRNAGPGGGLYVAIGEPLLGDLDQFAKYLLSNWSVECPKRGRPQPVVVLAVSLSLETNSKFMNTAVASNKADLLGDLRPLVSSVMDDGHSAMKSISDRLIEISSLFNASWDGKQWHRITMSTPNITTTTIPKFMNGCAAVTVCYWNLIFMTLLGFYMYQF